MPRLIVIGGSGQLAQALAQRTWPADWRVSAGGRERFDLRNVEALERALDAAPSDLLINAAAYTAVDKAESEPEAAMKLNRDGPAALARYAKRRGIPLIHVSTDYVFDGAKTGAYGEGDPVAPQSQYGRSKEAGEAAIRSAHRDSVILRTSWVFSATGQNFVSTMLRLATSRREIGVVDDQRGRPTYAGDLADWIGEIAQRLLQGQGKFGTFHAANAETVTWYGFAAAIFAAAKKRGLPCPEILKPIATADYPTAARRPANSELDTSKLTALYGIEPARWRDRLDFGLDRLAS